MHLEHIHIKNSAIAVPANSSW